VARCSWALALGRKTESAAGVIVDYKSDALSRKRSLLNASRRFGLTLQFPFYHSYEEAQDEVLRLAKSCKANMSVHTVQELGVSIDFVRVWRHRSEGEKPPVNRVFVVAGEHARELIGSESVLHLLRALCGEVALTGDHNAEEALKDSEFEIILNASPRARELVEEGDYCRRLNLRGVDLNRNWDEQWSASHSVGGSGGPQPFSEPETRLIRQVVQDYKPTLFLSVHSGTRGLYMPWAYEVKQELNQKQQAMMRVLAAVDADHCRCPFGAAGHEVGYACPGTSIDWAYGHLKTPYTFAFEIWGGNASLLQRRWEDKLREDGVAALGLQLSHPHFRSIFEQHPSDFVKSELVIAHDKEAVNTRAMSSADRAKVFMTCFRTFNPATWSSYQEAIGNWAEAFLDTARLVAADILSQQKER